MANLNRSIWGVALLVTCGLLAQGTTAAGGTVTVRRTPTGEWASLTPGRTGGYVIPVEQGERIEVQLPAGGSVAYTGAQLVREERRTLPLGSSLDKNAGIFYWQPAAGFLGAYELAFAPAGDVAQEVRVRVVVGPSLRMSVATPAADASVAPGFAVAGWVADLASGDGAGIDAVHVWAYPLGGGAPTFVGLAEVGEARPDVAAVYGPQFTNVAFSVEAGGLGAGAYDLVLYPHHVATGTFDGAQVVRVTVQ